MKKRICHLFIILFSAFFFMLSSGVVIKVHECCHKHHHAKNDHRHCHETKIFIKIEENFVKSKTTQLYFPQSETVLFSFTKQQDVFEIITPLFLYSIPPLIKFAGINFVNFTSQRVLYS
jgi:hypothetical protein